MTLALSKPRFQQNTPLSDGDSGKDAKGRFAPGNRHSRGPSRASINATRCRFVLLRMVTADDIAQIAAALLSMAKAGDIEAVRLLLDYTIGRAVKVSDIRNNDAGSDLPPIVIIKYA